MTANHATEPYDEAMNSEVLEKRTDAMTVEMQSITSAEIYSL